VTQTPEYASPIDLATYGEYAIKQQPGDPRPLYRFSGRVTADGSSGFDATAGRYHLYAGWFCPWSQRVTIQIALNGLSDVIGVSYVDDVRDGRGWAFRKRRGADEVNGFTLLRQAYEATEPGFDGHISTPTLWDRVTGRVVSNEYANIGLDVATQFTEFSDPSVDSYPEALRAEIDRLDRWLGPTVHPEALDTLDARLASQRYLLGPRITEADVRLFVTLVRYDVQADVGRATNPGLTDYPNLWAYARDLYAHRAFASTTDFGSFAAPGATIPDWTELTDRANLARRAA
jgi:putative glutathione S-transferase